MIDTGAIRNGVLRNAFVGKLVPQNKSDGNAKELLRSIGAEDKALQFCDGPFDIPQTWNWIRLEDLYEINPKVEADENIDAAFIPMEKIEAGYRSEYSYEVQQWGVASKNHTKFMDGDVAFAKISPCFENRKSFIAESLPNEIGGGTTELIILRQAAMNVKYTLYLVLDQRFINNGSSSYKGVVGQQRVKSEVIKNYLIPVPPLAEQQRIVERVESIFSLLDEIDEAQTGFVKNQESLRNKLIETVLFASNYGKITTEEFSKHMDLISGRDLSTSEYNDKGNGIPYYTGASNFDNGRLTVNRWTESPAVISKQGDLLVTCKGTVGKMAYATETAHIARQIMAIRPKDIDVEYAYYFMEYYVATLKKKAKGLIPGIERKDLLAAPFPFREEQEQKRIVDKLNELLPLCS